MSQLIGHIKALRALGKAFGDEGKRMADNSIASILLAEALAYHKAADDLEAQARAEASGPSYEDRPQPMPKRGR